MIHRPMESLLDACSEGDVNKVNTLLAAGADLEARSSNQYTALLTAADHGHAQVVSTLLAAGADRDVQDVLGDTPSHIAAKNGFVIDVYMILLKAGADMMIRNSQNKSAKDIASVSCMPLTKAPNSIVEVTATSQPTNTPTYYLKGCCIGSGRYGRVNLFYELDTGNAFAFKQIDSGEFTSQKELIALQNEIGLLKKCDHPNIVAYYGAGYIDGCFSIILENVEGGSIRKYIQDNGPLSNELATRCLFQMLKGLSYLHSNKIIHRDLKAANVLMTSDQIIKIADFGISKRLDTLMSGADTFVGTPYWMAPEVIRGEKYTDKVDIWGVGVTAFEFLTGNPPFFDREGTAALFKIAMVKDMKDELKFPDDIDTSLRSCILNCVLVQPDQRPSADDLLDTELFLSS